LAIVEHRTLLAQGQTHSARHGFKCACMDDQHGSYVSGKADESKGKAQAMNVLHKATKSQWLDKLL
jgi:hypothetical protein